VNTAPQVSFSVASTTGCAPYTVSFLNSTTNATDYLWDFGDGGSTSTLENPDYTYNSAGTYTVSLNATVGSCADALTIVDYITVNPSPVASFNDFDVCHGNVIDFTNTSTGATGYSWDFGDGTGVSSLVDPSYTYLSANTFTVTLIATDGTCNDTITSNVIVSPTPIANFTSGNACLGNAIDFTNTSSGATGFTWDFGDAIGNSSIENPAYVYQLTGTFTVTLVATEGLCTDTITGDVNVFALPVFDFGPDITTNSVTYLLDAGAGFSGYLWNNGSTSQSITADTNGLYCVIVTDINTCSDTDCVNVTLDPDGIENYDEDYAFILFPNPAQNSFTVFISKEVAGATCDMRIFDAVGRQIFIEVLTSEMTTITTSNWPRGIYSVEINSDENVLRKKLILY
jgi:PKD repeat protein